MIFEASSGLDVLCFFWIRRTFKNSYSRKRLPYTQHPRAENRGAEQEIHLRRWGHFRRLPSEPAGHLRNASWCLAKHLSAKDLLLCSLPPFLCALFYRNIPRKLHGTVWEGGHGDQNLGYNVALPLSNVGWFPRNLSLLIYNMCSSFLPRGLWISKRSSYESLCKVDLILTLLHPGYGPALGSSSHSLHYRTWRRPHLIIGVCTYKNSFSALATAFSVHGGVLGTTLFYCPLWFFLEFRGLAWVSFKTSDEYYIQAHVWYTIRPLWQDGWGD